MISRQVRSLLFRAFASTVGVAACSGCRGNADIHFVSLHTGEIDPPPAKVWSFAAQEAYWWIDDAGELCISIRCRKRNLLLGKFGKLDLSMSLIPGPPPAGSGRNYPIRRREARTILNSLLQDQRLTSFDGVMTVIVDDPRAIHGSFRIWMKPVRQLMLLSIIPRQPGDVLCFGTFRAVKDEVRGKAIRAACEAGGWRRRPTQAAPTTQPAKSEKPD